MTIQSKSPEEDSTAELGKDKNLGLTIAAVHHLTIKNCIDELYK